jgi:hypothetical protein
MITTTFITIYEPGRGPVTIKLGEEGAKIIPKFNSPDLCKSRSSQNEFPNFH